MLILLTRNLVHLGLIKKTNRKAKQEDYLLKSSVEGKKRGKKGLMEEEYPLAKLCRESRIIQHKQELQHAHK